MSGSTESNISLEAEHFQQGYIVRVRAGKWEVGRLWAVIQSDREVLLSDLKVEEEISVHRAPLIPLLPWIRPKPIVKSYRGKGIGRRMLRHFLDWCREMEIHEVHGSVVQNDLEGSPWLLDWYRRCGFEVHPPDERCLRNAKHMIVWRNDDPQPSGGTASKGRP